MAARREPPVTPEEIAMIRTWATLGYGDHTISVNMARPRQWVCVVRNAHGIPPGVPRGHRESRTGEKRPRMPKTFDLVDTEEL